MQPQTMTEPPLCFTDGCRHSQLYLFALSSYIFEPEISHLYLSLHMTCCHRFSVQFLCNLTYFSLFSLFPFFINHFLTTTIPTFLMISKQQMDKLTFYRFSLRKLEKICVCDRLTVTRGHKYNLKLIVFMFWHNTSSSLKLKPGEPFLNTT